MTRMKPAARRLVVLLTLTCTVGVPTAAFAQAAVVGSVTDPSSAPLAGVAVEAVSNAVIEKTRTTVTDAAGRYRIENLRPGIYDVWFTLSGWKAYRLEGLELTGSFTATVDAQLALGDLTDTVTVTASSPVVDTHSAGRELTLPGDAVRSLPTVRSYNALLVLAPGVVTNISDTVVGPATISFALPGGRQNEGSTIERRFRASCARHEVRVRGGQGLPSRSSGPRQEGGPPSLGSAFQCQATARQPSRGSRSEGW